MREIELVETSHGFSFRVGGQQIKVGWAKGLAKQLEHQHGIDARAEILDGLTQVLSQDPELSDEERKEVLRIAKERINKE